MIADQSAHHPEQHVLACGYTLERIVRDYGVDYQLFTYDDSGQAEPGHVLLQLKATSSMRFHNDRRVVAHRVARADLRRWLRELMPVILVVYDVQEDVAYWAYIQAHFRRLPDFSLDRIGETVTIHIPISNRLDTASIRRFAGGVAHSTIDTKSLEPVMNFATGQRPRMPYLQWTMLPSADDVSIRLADSAGQRAASSVWGPLVASPRLRWVGSAPEVHNRL